MGTIFIVPHYSPQSPILVASLIRKDVQNDPKVTEKQDLLVMPSIHSEVEGYDMYPF